MEKEFLMELGIDEVAADTILARHGQELDHLQFTHQLEDAIFRAGGRSVKAICALLDVDAIRASEDRAAATPAGAKILPYRSNVPKLSEFCFTVCDKDFPERAKAKGGGVILGGQNYGQGSSREHAALVPLYLGVKAVIAKSFARIHMANLINFGIAPITLKNEEDYEKIAEGDEILIEGFSDAIASKNEATLVVKSSGDRIPLVLSFSERQREILLAGGTLNYTKAKSK